MANRIDRVSDEVNRNGMSVDELVDLLRENYWYLQITGAQAMADLWSDVNAEKVGLEETVEGLGTTVQEFVVAASLLGQWFAVNDLLYKTPMEQSVEVRTEKLGFPDGPW